MLALFPKVPNTQHPKALKINIFDYLTVVWRPLPANPYHREYPHRTYTVRNYTHWATSSPLLVWVYLHSIFPCRLWKTHVLCNGVCNGGSKSSKVDFGTNRKRICDFLLVINSNLGLILPVSEILQVFCWDSDPTPIPPEFWGCSPWTRLLCWGFEEQRP